jgi:hypothetical protein
LRRNAEPNDTILVSRWTGTNLPGPAPTGYQPTWFDANQPRPVPRLPRVSTGAHVSAYCGQSHKAMRPRPRAGCSRWYAFVHPVRKEPLAPCTRCAAGERVGPVASGQQCRLHPQELAEPHAQRKRWPCPILYGSVTFARRPLRAHSHGAAVEGTWSWESNTEWVWARTVEGRTTAAPPSQVGYDSNLGPNHSHCARLLQRCRCLHRLFRPRRRVPIRRQLLKRYPRQRNRVLLALQRR